MKKTNMNVCYKKMPEVLWRAIDDQVILIHKDQIFNLRHESAVFIWQLLNGRNKLIDIKQKLLKEFNIEPSELEVDLKGFVKKLSGLGIIREVA